MRLTTEEGLRFPLKLDFIEKIGEDTYVNINPRELLDLLDHDEKLDLARAMWEEPGPGNVLALIAELEEIERDTGDDGHVGAAPPEHMDEHGDRHAHPTDAYRR